MRRCIPVLVSILALTCGGPGAQAGPIQYTESVVASGSLNGVAYSNAQLTFVATGDTDGIVNGFGNPRLFYNPVDVTFTVAGLGGGEFTGPYIVFSAQDSFIAGITQGTTSSPVQDLLHLSSSFFSTYALRTPVGQFSGRGGFSPGQAFASTAGDLVINSISGNIASNSTFSASLGIAAVPEPSTLAGAGLGVALAVGAALRRRKVASA